MIANASDVAIPQTWAASKVLADQCLDVEQDIGDFIGTASVARDLMSIVDAIEDDGMLRYWGEYCPMETHGLFMFITKICCVTGLSYGATLGQTVAAMFPDRVDRIVVDAVQNVHEYYYGLADIEEWADSDKLFSAIWSTCLDAGAELCPLAASWESASKLEAAVWDLTYSLKHSPLAVGTKKSVFLDYQTIKGLWASSLYNPNTWPVTASIVDKLLKNQIDDELHELLVAALPLTIKAKISAAITNMVLNGIHCSDRIPRTNNLEDMQPVWDELYSTSRVQGDIQVVAASACAQWRFNAQDRYEGGFENVTTHHPMLLIGNTLDGHTPLKSAYNASAIFQDSVVLQIDGYGHGSTSARSACAYNLTAAYFVNGTLPEVGTICPIDVQPYTGIVSP